MRVSAFRCLLEVYAFRLEVSSADVPPSALLCRPNCIAKLVDVKGRKRVFIFATQQIAPMEELT